MPPPGRPESPSHVGSEVADLTGPAREKDLLSAYDALAEFHDLFMAPAWERLRPAVRHLVGSCTSSDVVVEIGAGSGVGTSVIAAECPAEIFALEPHPTMRAMLLGRVGADPDLAARVTVIPAGAPDGLGSLPEEVHAVVIAHVLGHMDRTERLATWAAVAERLVPPGAILVTTQEAPDADTDDDAVESRRIGRHTYTARHHAGRTDDGPSSFRSTYQVHEGEQLVRERTVRGHWSPIGLAQVREEVALSGLVAKRFGPGLALVKASPRAGRRALGGDAPVEAG